MFGTISFTFDTKKRIYKKKQFPIRCFSKSKLLIYKTLQKTTGITRLASLLFMSSIVKGLQATILIYIIIGYIELNWWRENGMACTHYTSTLSIISIGFIDRELLFLRMIRMCSTGKYQPKF